MARRGRKRSTRARYKGGRILPPREPLVPVEIESRRRKLLGDHDKHSTRWMRDQKLGTVLGRMLKAGKITERQYEAGDKVTTVWCAWARMAECPSRHARAADLPIATDIAAVQLTPGEIDMLARTVTLDEVERWERLQGTMAALRKAVAAVEHSALAWSLLDTVCADDMVPPALESNGPLADKCWAALRAALDAAAKVFKLPEQKEAA